MLFPSFAYLSISITDIYHVRCVELECVNTTIEGDTNLHRYFLYVKL